MIALLWLAYGAAVEVAVFCVLAPLELLRAALGKARRGDLAQRMGRCPPPGTARARIVVHAVSTGEMTAAGALVSALLARRPATRFVLTTGNRHGADAGERLRQMIPAVDAVSLMPWDRRRAVRSWLRAVAPEAVVVVETEIWPNLFRSCDELGIPLFVVNGRLYPGDVARYRAARRFFAEVLDAVRWIGALDDDAARALVRIGAPPERTEAVGNLKFDAGSAVAELPGRWREVLGDPERGPLVVAGSTHAPEERLLLDALVSLRRLLPRVRLVLAPRRVGRAARLARVAASRGLTAALWSHEQPALSPWDVLLIDEVGPLAAIFRYADVVFIGGSLAPRGGHNPLEAASCGRPVVMGPSGYNFHGIVRAMAAAGALTLLGGDGNALRQLTDTLADLLLDPAKSNAMGKEALAFVEAQRGVAARYASALLGRLDTATSRR